MVEAKKKALIADIEDCIEESIYKALTPGELAGVIFKEILEPVIEDEVDKWIRLGSLPSRNPQ